MRSPWRGCLRVNISVMYTGNCYTTALGEVIPDTTLQFGPDTLSCFNQWNIPCLQFNFSGHTLGVAYVLWDIMVKCELL